MKKSLLVTVLLLCLTVSSTTAASQYRTLGLLKDENPRPTEYVTSSNTNPSDGAPTLSSVNNNNDLPEYLNYGDKFPNEHTNQMGCGSCYAHAIAATMEAVQCRKTLASGSYAYIANVVGRFCHTIPRNEMIHCFEFNHGCNGGFIEKTLDRILQLGGLYNNCERLNFVPNAFLQGHCTPDPTGDYKVWNSDTKSYLLHQDGNVCLRPKYNIHIFFTRRSWFKKYISVEPTVEQLKRALVQYGPLVISMDVTEAWNSFGYDDDSWLYNPSKNCKSIGSHAVVLIGYYKKNVRTGKQYWIFRNSYGKKWGFGGDFVLDTSDSCHSITRAYALLY